MPGRRKEPAAARVTGPASYFPSIERSYGRPIAEWKAIIREHRGLKHMELVALLKSEYGMGHGHANALVGDTLHEDAPPDAASAGRPAPQARSTQQHPFVLRLGCAGDRPKCADASGL